MTRTRRWIGSFLGLGALAGCAQIVGLTGDYHEAPVHHGGSGGVEPPNAGDGGETSSGGTAGSQAGTASGGEGNAGRGGTTGGKNVGGATGGGTAGNAGDAGSSGIGGAGAGDGGSGGGGAPTRPGCDSLPTTCGLHADADCCSTALIPGDRFNRSNDARYPATVSDFRLDTFEVTVGRFRRFVDAFEAGYQPPSGSGRNPNDASDPGWDPAWDELLPQSRDELLGTDKGVKCVDPGNPPNFWTWTDTAGTGDNRPVNCLDWYVAHAFCIWDGGRLPTEAEWNFAAAGGRQQRHFPWSDPPALMTIGETYASYNVDATRQCGGDGMDGCAPTDIVPVGSKKDGYALWGHADLAGNLWEWVRDAFAPYSSDCLDCARFDSGSNRVGRGGCYFSNSGLLDTPTRVEFPPSERTTAIGVRCARGVSE